LQLLREVVPNAALFGVLGIPDLGGAGAHAGPATLCCECQNR
jgi:hypothetical protein